MTFYMNCQYCQDSFPENKIEVSHDIPKYVGGTDINGRHNLCHRCHNKYELHLLKKFLDFLGEEFEEEEKINWMIELKRLDNRLKEKLRTIAKKESEAFFK